MSDFTDTKKNKNKNRNKDRHLKSEGRWAPVYSGVLFSVIPILCFYLMEFFDRNPFAQIRTEAHFFNILLFELAAWILYLVTGRARIALGFEILLSAVWGLGNHFVYAFRSTPFMPWDLLSIRTAASVASNYEFTLTARLGIVLFLFLLLFIFTMAVMKRRAGLPVWGRLFLAAGLSAVLSVFALQLQKEEFQNEHNLYPFLFTPNVMIKYDGMAVAFTMELAYLWVEKPAGYDPEAAAEILKNYEQENTTAEKPEQLPNIIVIMDEAFSDLAVLGDFKVNEDYMPFVHSLMDGAEDVVSGWLNVSVCGGNTANSEFEFLTGNTMAFLPTGSIPYQQYIRKKVSSLADHLESLGYVTYAQHPYYGSGWERERVYPLLGFSNMNFLDDYAKRTLIRKYVSDKDCFNKIIETYENKPEDQPLFVFNVTMQNHGGYSDTTPDFINTITAEGFSNKALDQYLSLLKVTDTELQKLIAYFEECEEKTVVVFFGDHQPNDTAAYSILKANGMDYTALSDEERELRYQVPYFIWANYDIEEETGADTSVNYLAARALTAAGVPTSDYQNYLLDLEKTVPILSAVREEPALDVDRETADEALEEYRRLQYYRLFDEE